MFGSSQLIIQINVRLQPASRTALGKPTWSTDGWLIRYPRYENVVNLDRFLYLNQFENYNE